MRVYIVIVCVLLANVGCKNEPKNETEESSTANTHSKNDYLIVPGERVGMITGKSTETDIENAYGKKNIRISEITVAEDEQQKGTLIFPETNNEVEIVWELEADIGRPAFVRLGRESSEWKTIEGLRVGTTLEELEKMNGGPFLLYGFEWDYGGLVTNWNDGKLSPYLIVALIPQDFSALTPDLLGEIQLSSDNPKVRALKAKVGSIVITFE